MRGLGDLVAWVVYPIAYMLRRFGWLGVEMTPESDVTVEYVETRPAKGCGCKQRQQKLNEFIPFK